MILPSLLPSDYVRYMKADSDETLLKLLKENTHEFVTFFEYAAEDGTWCEHHLPFMRSALQWFTTQFYSDLLQLESARRIANTFWGHQMLLLSCLTKDLTVKIGKESEQVNSLLMAVSSEVFFDLIRTQKVDAEQRIVVLDNATTDLFNQIAEFITTRDVPTLWKHRQNEIIDLLRLAVRFELRGLKEICEDVLKRYITKENVLDTLVEAHLESWDVLQEHCFSFINSLNLGVRLFSVKQRRVDISEKEVQALAFEFLDFSDVAQDMFERLKSFITHYVCSGSLTEDPAFSTTIKACPNIIALDISRSLRYTDRLSDMPQALQEIDISKCLWLTDANLQKMISYSPNVIRLTLNSNSQLTFKGWGELMKFHQMRALDVSRCNQVNDEIFVLILKSSHHLVELGVEECKRISEKGFFEISRNLPELAFLNVARTYISDAAIIDVASRCRMLRSLDVTRCVSITEKGIIQTVRQATKLRELVITGCNISDAAISRIREQYPYLKLLTASF